MDKERKALDLLVDNIIRTSPVMRRVGFKLDEVERRIKKVWWSILVAFITGVAVGFLIGYVCR